jgi:uncharacterized protein (TIGR03067 family)
MEMPDIEADERPRRLPRRRLQIGLFGFLMFIGFLGVSIGIIATHFRDYRKERRLVEEDKEALQGTWEGRGFPVLLFAGDSVVSAPGGMYEETGRFDINPTTYPKTIDITFGDQDARGYLGTYAYELEGDTLRLTLIGSSSTGSPSGWESAKGQRTFVLHRGANARKGRPGGRQLGKQ